jgi:hypothetical protein
MFRPVTCGAGSITYRAVVPHIAHAQFVGQVGAEHADQSYRHRAARRRLPGSGQPVDDVNLAGGHEVTVGDVDRSVQTPVRIEGVIEPDDSLVVVRGRRIVERETSSVQPIARRKVVRRGVEREHLQDDWIRAGAARIEVARIDRLDVPLASRNCSRPRFIVSVGTSRVTFVEPRSRRAS